MKTPVEVISKRIFGEDSEIFGSLNLIFKNLRDSLIGNCERCLSDSFILCGPSKSGKTLIISHIEKFLTTKYKDDVLVITINALLHTQTTMVNEILSQLNEEWLLLNSEEKSKIKLKKLGDILKEGINKKVLMLVINDIDVLSSFKKQALLYVLFDSIRSANYSLFVAGTTQLTDASNRFEKRVNSRFTQKILMTYPSDSFDDYFNHLKSVLLVKRNESWNARVDSIFEENNKIKKLYQRLFNQDNTIGKLYQSLIIPLNNINEIKSYLVAEDFELSLTILLASSRKLYLMDFPKNEIILLAVIWRHFRQYSTSTLTKRNILLACKSFFETDDGRNIKLSNRDIDSAFDSLIHNKIFVLNNSNLKTINATEAVSYSLCYSDEEIREVLKDHNHIPLTIKLFK